MNGRLDEEKKGEVSLEELVLANSYEVMALIAVLEQKGLLTRDEIMQEIEGLSKRKK